MAIRSKRPPNLRRSSGAKNPGLLIGAGVGGLLLLLVVVAAVSGAISSKKPTTPSPNGPQITEVLIAIQDIDDGMEVTPNLFKKETRERSEFARAGVVTNVEQLRGLYARSFIPAGQILLADHLTAQAPVNSLVPQIHEGFRAITIKLDKQTTNEGWARAGVRVDVMFAATQVSAQGSAQQASIIAQNVRVLSSGTSVSSDFGGDTTLIQNGESTVTLEVSSEDQKRLKLAAGKGELRLLLRGDEDTSELSERIKIPLTSIIMGPSELSDPSDKSPDQGWVMIDGKKYRLVGAELIPG